MWPSRKPRCPLGNLKGSMKHAAIRGISGWRRSRAVVDGGGRNRLVTDRYLALSSAGASRCESGHLARGRLIHTASRNTTRMTSRATRGMATLPTVDWVGGARASLVGRPILAAAGLRPGRQAEPPVLPNLPDPGRHFVGALNVCKLSVCERGELLLARSNAWTS